MSAPGIAHQGHLWQVGMLSAALAAAAFGPFASNTRKTKFALVE